jgi:uncharacterized protein (DUF2062 family)
LLKAISIGFGVFMGIVPIWGFQLVTAIALSILFRLNKALVIIAANISIPPMIPLIIYLSHLTGKIWMGENAQSIAFTDEITLDFIHKNAVQYFSGAVTLSMVAGILFGMISYFLLLIFKKRPGV